MKMKRALLLIFLLVAGAIFGALIAEACADVSGMQWLAFGRTIGFNSEAPLVLDLAFFRFTFGLSFDVSIAQVFTIALAILAYNLATRNKQ